MAFNRLWIVAGDTLYQYDGTTLTTVGTVVDDGLSVCMTHNINELLVVSGGEGYTVQNDLTTFAIIADTDFPNASRCGFLDGYGILLEKSSGRFWYTTVNDFEAISGTDFATAERSPDDTVSMLVDHRELWLFGEHTTEVWFNSGDSNNPFQPLHLIERGCKGLILSALRPLIGCVQTSG